MLYRIKYLLGTLVTLFSIFYLLIGTVGWVDRTMNSTDLITCFILASVHLGSGGWLLLSSLKQYKSEQRALEMYMHRLIRVNGGRVLASDLAREANISQEDAHEYLDKRLQKDVAVLMQNRAGVNVYFFGQQFWNN